MSDRMEAEFGHLFDQIIINEDIEQATSELKMAAHRLETEPMWVPANWIAS